MPPDEPALQCLYTTQAFQPCANPLGAGLVALLVANPQKDYPSLTDRGRRTRSSTTTLLHY